MEKYLFYLLLPLFLHLRKLLSSQVVHNHTIVPKHSSVYYLSLVHSVSFHSPNFLTLPVTKIKSILFLFNVNAIAPVCLINTTYSSSVGIIENIWETTGNSKGFNPSG